MTTLKEIIQKKTKYLPLLLSFIIADEMCNSYILNIFTEKNSVIEHFLYFLFLITSILMSPIQASYSDFYCRRFSLIFSLSCSLISLLFIFFIELTNFYSVFFLFIIIFIKGGLGNTLPLSWAAIADTRTKNFRFSLGLSTSAMAFGYLTLIGLKQIFNTIQSITISIFMFIVLIFLCIKFFQDIRDRTLFQKKSLDTLHRGHIFKTFKHHILSDIKIIFYKFLKDSRTRFALLSFMLWEISFYTALISDVDMHLGELSHLSFSILIGYVIGVVVLKFLWKKSDKEMIKIGLVISILSLTPIFFFRSNKIILISYFFYSLAAAFLAPSLFSILSKEHGVHEQGKIYGLIDSSDTIAFCIASLFVLYYHHSGINIIYLPLFSYLTFLISLIPYEKFKKMQKNNS